LTEINKTLEKAFSTKAYQQKYHSDSFKRELIKYFVDESITRQGYEKKDGFDKETIAFATILTNGTFSIRITKSGLFKIDFISELPEKYIDHIESCKTHLRFHFNHIYFIIRDKFHNHQYYRFEYGLPYLSDDEEKTEDFVQNYFAQLKEHMEISLESWMAIIDDSEKSWKEKFSSRFYFIDLPSQIWLFNDLNKKESNATHKIWTLGYMKRNIHLMGDEFNPPTNLLDTMIDDFSSLFDARRWIITSMKNAISHSYTLLSTALAIAALPFALILTGSFESLPLYLLGGLLIAALIGGILSIEGAKKQCLIQLEMNYEGKSEDFSE